MQKQYKRHIQSKDLVRSYVDFENRLKAMEENLKNISTNDSENK